MGKSSISKGVVKDIIIVVVGVLVIWFALQAVFGTQNPFYVVSSGSMIPELQVYDVLVVQGNVPFEEIDVGDIIVFDRPSGHDRVIVHRVVDIIDQDPKTIRTKGDANPASIPGTDFPITEEEYIGEVAYVVPQIGYVTRILTPPINYIIIAVIVGIMIVKQLAKKKREDTSKLSEPEEFSNDDTDSDVTFENKDLDNIPKDNEYSDVSSSNNEDTTQNEIIEPDKIGTSENKIEQEEIDKIRKDFNEKYGDDLSESDNSEKKTD